MARGAAPAASPHRSARAAVGHVPTTNAAGDLRAPVDNIAAPLFPRSLPWVNVPEGSQVSVIQRGRPLLVEFWDFCRPNSIRTLPYLKAWHERYADDGLRSSASTPPALTPLATSRRCAPPSSASASPTRC